MTDETVPRGLVLEPFRFAFAELAPGAHEDVAVPLPGPVAPGSRAEFFGAVPVRYSLETFDFTVDHVAGLVWVRRRNFSTSPLPFQVFPARLRIFTPPETTA